MVRHLGGAARLQSALARSDAQLLEQFAVGRDQAAFEALLHRHGPLVFGVCRRMLFDAHDAEDAFQATFLVLARRAGQIARRSLLSNWLYGVAFRVAARARRNAARRRAIERPDVDPAAVAESREPADPDLGPVLHEELQRLPDKYRGPVVLCYLEGKTTEAAADQLNWPVGTVKTRLDKARELLRSRLTRRGAALTAGLWAADALTAAPPAPLLGGTVQAALPFAAGHAVASTHVLTLSTGVLRAMFLNKLKAVAAAALAVAVILGTGGLAWHALAEPAKAEKPKVDKDAIVGHWKIEKVEEDGMDASETGEGKKLKGATLDITADKIVLPDVGEIAYKLDPTAKPKAIDLDNGGGKTFDCVYTLDGDTLTICAPLMPGGPRPTEVASKAGSGTRVVVMKREGK